MSKQDKAYSEDKDYDAEHLKSALYKAYMEHMQGNGLAGGSRYSDPEVGHEEVTPKNEGDFVAPDHAKGSGDEPEKEHGAKDPLAKKVAKGTDKNQGHTSANMNAFLSPRMSEFQRKLAKFKKK